MHGASTEADEKGKGGLCNATQTPNRALDWAAFRAHGGLAGALYRAMIRAGSTISPQSWPSPMLLPSSTGGHELRGTPPLPLPPSLPQRPSLSPSQRRLRVSSRRAQQSDDAPFFGAKTIVLLLLPTGKGRSGSIHDRSMCRTHSRQPSYLRSKLCPELYAEHLQL